MLLLYVFDSTFVFVLFLERDFKICWNQNLLEICWKFAVFVLFLERDFKICF